LTIYERLFSCIQFYISWFLLSHEHDRKVSGCRFPSAPLLHSYFVCPLALADLPAFHGHESPRTFNDRVSIVRFTALPVSSIVAKTISIVSKTFEKSPLRGWDSGPSFLTTTHCYRRHSQFARILHFQLTSIATAVRRAHSRPSYPNRSTTISLKQFITSNRKAGATVDFPGPHPRPC
jgi:hypothetical protein